MILEAALAYLHLSAILAWVVFITSTAALARTEWINPAVVERLVVVDRIAFIAGGAVVATGLARWGLGIKGAAWYGMQPMLWGKIVLFGHVGLTALRTRAELARWQAQLRADGRMPSAEAVQQLRKQVMRAAHLMLVLPLLAVMLARGLP